MGTAGSQSIIDTDRQLKYHTSFLSVIEVLWYDNQTFKRWIGAQ